MAAVCDNELSNCKSVVIYLSKRSSNAKKTSVFQVSNTISRNNFRRISGSRKAHGSKLLRVSSQFMTAAHSEVSLTRVSVTDPQLFLTQLSFQRQCASLLGENGISRVTDTSRALTTRTRERAGNGERRESGSGLRRSWSFHTAVHRRHDRRSFEKSSFVPDKV